MKTSEKTPCTCGQTQPEYNPVDNIHEPACWECYEREQEEMCEEEYRKMMDEIVLDMKKNPQDYHALPDQDDDLPF